MSLLETFQKEVEVFIATRKMRHTKFGKLAMNDPSFVSRLRDGLEVKAPTIDKVRKFMLTHQVDNNKSKAA